MARRDAVPDEIFQVVELVNGKPQGEVVAAPDFDRGLRKPIDYNTKVRLYVHGPTALAYKNRLEKEGRKVRIRRFVFAEDFYETDVVRLDQKPVEEL
ncbi:hypothetical protein MYRNA_257 [Mycobacterium phage Myrna]|uniref:Uncharacterized protein n=1 Tax=Mycobacterium phage Myrna TaxID=546805 RepID=B5LJM7_9CAUD|nr:gp257 [Mycobacterium phage Myrna]ACH62224.1 hypothetical protein MYRNA_257 [Mycobacterium phage Myrna]